MTEETVTDTELATTIANDVSKETSSNVERQQNDRDKLEERKTIVKSEEMMISSIQQQQQQQQPNHRGLIDHYDGNKNNLQLLDNFIGPLNINENITFNIKFMDEPINNNNNNNINNNNNNNIINDKCPLTVFKTEIKNENYPPHYIKYRIDKGKSLKVWQCGICSKEFGHQYVLMRHLPTHTDERKFRCLICGKAFRQMSTLSQHKAIHSADRPYVCELCNKTFNRVSTLISHRKTHTGHKPHSCHICNKAFHQKGNLRNHIFTHTNERPYKCDVCAKGFNQMSNLMCHKIKVHQRSDKPKYSCRICEKEFQKRIGLRNHEQFEHGLSSGRIPSNMLNNPVQNYANSILLDPIQTPAMVHALATNQIPFALLKPINGDPVLVRVFPAGEKQMLLPATAEDLKRQGIITINPKTSEISGIKEDTDEDNGVNTLTGSTVQIRVPVVATVVQTYNQQGVTCMYIETDEKKYDYVYADDKKVIANNEYFKIEEFVINTNNNIQLENATNDVQFIELTNVEQNEEKSLESFITEVPMAIDNNNVDDSNKTKQANAEIHVEGALDLSNSGDVNRSTETTNGSDPTTITINNNNNDNLPVVPDKSQGVTETGE